MNPLKSITGTILMGVILALGIAFAIGSVGPVSTWGFVIWIHVIVGIAWVGLLYYFNFIQVPALAEAAADEGGPGGAGITKYVAPRALLWFRWAAVATWLSGAWYLMVNGELINAFTFDGAYGTSIGVGAWMGTIMLFNVWVLIWPNQKKVLGLVEATAEQIGRAKSTALMASRTNTMLSIPLLMSMVSGGHGFPL